MNYDDVNLGELLELGLRYPEIGAVNFNIVYLILKTIIEKQGLHNLKPASSRELLTVSDSDESRSEKYESRSEKYESRSEKYKRRSEKSEESDNNKDIAPSSDATASNGEDWLQFSKKVESNEQEIQKLHGIIEELANKVSYLETLTDLLESTPPSEADDQEKVSYTDQEKVSYTDQEKITKDEKLETPKPEVESTSSQNVKVESELENPQASTIEKTADVSQQKAESSRKKLKELNDLKKDVNEMKRKDIEVFRLQSDLKVMKDKNLKMEKKLDLLVMDFDALMIGYGKLSSQIEDFEICASKQLEMEDQMERLEDRIERIKDYKSARTKAEVRKELKYQESTDRRFFKDITEAAQRRGKYEASEDWTVSPDKIKTEMAETSDGNTLKLTPSTRKAFEAFLHSAERTEETQKPDEGEVPSKVELQEDTSPAPEEGDEVPEGEDSDDTEGEGEYKHKFRTAADAVMLIRDLKKSQFAARVAKAHENEARRAVPSKEIGRSVEQQLHKRKSVEHFDEANQAAERPEKSSRRGTLLSSEERMVKDLKAQIVLYMKNRLDEMEVYFMSKIRQIESAVKEVKDDNENATKQVTDILDRLDIIETKQNEKMGVLEVLENAVNGQENHIQSLKKDLNRKMEAFDENKSIGKDDLKVIEDRLLKMGEDTRLQIAELNNFLRSFATRVQEDLDDKPTGFNIDIRLEPLANRMKILEKKVKEMSLNLRFLEFDHLGPIQVRKYTHCQDGKRIKPSSLGGRTPWSSPESIAASRDCDKHFGENMSEDILADVQKRLEQVFLRQSSRHAGGTPTKHAAGKE